VGAAVLDAAQGMQQQRRGDVPQRQAADPRKQVFLHTLDPARGVARTPAAVLGGVQLAGHGLEGDAGHRLARQLVELALLGGVRALAQQLARIVTRFASVLQRDRHLLRSGLGVVAQCQALFLAAEAVLPEPAPRAVRRDLEVKACAVGQSHARAPVPPPLPPVAMGSYETV
jgi:hypothetical protein